MLLLRVEETHSLQLKLGDMFQEGHSMVQIWKEEEESGLFFF